MVRGYQSAQYEYRAHVVFVYISDGLYQRRKDKLGEYQEKSYYTAPEIAEALNRQERVYIIGQRDNYIHANFLVEQ